MTTIDPFSSTVRPVLAGNLGAVSAAHPLAAAAAQELLGQGGSAVDAAIAAQAVLCVTSPEACGLGGDMFMLVRSPDGTVLGVNGAGATSAERIPEAVRDDGSSVTVPGIVAAWATASERFGRTGLAAALAPAIRLARSGIRVSPRLVSAAREQRERLRRGGAAEWPVAGAAEGDVIAQPALAALIEAIAAEGPEAFYEGAMAEACARRIGRMGGTLTVADFAAHRTTVRPPPQVAWRGWRVAVQPPMSQGVLLAMALRGEERLGALAPGRLHHACVELTEASFAYRDRAAEGEALLDEPLSIDLERASRRGGPRAYLHTAAVAVADAAGLVASSLASVFDDFGSCILVPEGGFMLNNRAGGFTAPPNHIAPGKAPVHTLAPAMVETEAGCMGLATPGADGQVQTLLQILAGMRSEQLGLAEAIHRARWRSEDGRLLIERSHPQLNYLSKIGHDLAVLDDGAMPFGAVACAGIAGDTPFAVSDWRRQVWTGVA